VDFTVLDRYLLGASTDKAAVVDALLQERHTDPAAAPFYRALEAVGPRAADEALVALRVVLSGQAPTDERVRRLRALSAVARAAANDDAAGLKSARRRDGAVLGDLDFDGPNAAIAASASDLYAAELRR
jgi:hypothetical protein